jgi:D-alanine-D-alanine ligase
MINVIVLYGGKSTEHEVSCRSAAFVLRNLDRKKYNVVAIGVNKQGHWLPQNMTRILATDTKTIPIYEPELRQLTGSSTKDLQIVPEAIFTQHHLDKNQTVVFPVIHGANGEDGTLQGLLELSDVAFVGPDTLGSAVGMDKAIAKRIAVTEGIEVVPWIEAFKEEWSEQSKSLMKEAEIRLGLPLFVKPARLGSSVGVTKVRSMSEFVAACELAFTFDDKLLIEKGLDVREIECAVIGGRNPKVSLPGEINAKDFYSYEAKYVDADAATIKVPADLTKDQALEAQSICRKVYRALNLYGMSRVDLFLDKNSGKFFFNEVNTIPGFTEISQFPMLWSESGLKPADLLDELIMYAVARKTEKSKLKKTI